MLLTARAHSSGWSALRTKTSIAISTVPGSNPGGRPSGEVRSQTDAWIVPTGGDVYKGLFCDVIWAIETFAKVPPQTCTSLTAWLEKSYAWRDSFGFWLEDRRGKTEFPAPCEDEAMRHSLIDMTTYRSRSRLPLSVQPNYPRIEFIGRRWQPSIPPVE